MSRVVAFEFQRFALMSHMENLEAHCFLPEKQSAEWWSWLNCFASIDRMTPDVDRYQLGA
jgi:hypothetical protein